MKFKFPIRIHSNKKLRISQYYGDDRNKEWYKENNLNITKHNGIDYLLNGKRTQSYGTELPCIFPEAKVVRRYYTNAMSTTGNGLRIAYRDPQGVKWEAVYWHCSEVTEKRELKLGDTVALMGNSGLVMPKPTNKRPYNGTHCHFMLYRNGKLVNPILYMGVADVFYGKDTGIEKDLAPLAWVLSYISNKLKQYEKGK